MVNVFEQASHHCLFEQDVRRGHFEARSANNLRNSYERKLKIQTSRSSVSHVVLASMSASPPALLFQTACSQNDLEDAQTRKVIHGFLSKTDIVASHDDCFLLYRRLWGVRELQRVVSMGNPS